MARPFPVLPRGPRRVPKPKPQRLLAVPRVAPDWELGALEALMMPKAKTRDAIRHRSSQQAWPADAAARVEAACALARDRLGYDPQPHLPDAGDFLLAMSVDEVDLPRAMAFAVLLSNALPAVWIILGRLYVRDGRFFRRERGVKLNLIPAAKVHLTRQMRAAIRGSGGVRERGSEGEMPQTHRGSVFSPPLPHSPSPPL